MIVGLGIAGGGVLIYIYSASVEFSLFGGSLVVFGVVILFGVLPTFLPPWHIVTVDAFGVFDRRSMTAPVPWSAVTNISAKLMRH